MSVAPGLAQNPALASVPVQVIVTVKPRHAVAVPVLGPEDFKVVQGRQQLSITGAIPLERGSTALELLLVIDDAASPSLRVYLPEIGRFITTQPSSTLVGLAWLHPAGVEIAVPPTTDRKRAVVALHAPTDTVTRPYFLLSELIRRWPSSAAPREIVLLTSGADPSAGDGVSNRSLDAVINDAQRAGIIIHGMSIAISGPPRTVAAVTRFADSYLGRLTDETGGAFYPTGPPLEPHFSDLSRRLANQYRVTFLAMPADKTRFVPVKLTTGVSNAQIVAAPARAYVPVVPVGP